MIRPEVNESVEDVRTETELEDDGGSLLTLSIAPRTSNVSPLPGREQAMADLWRTLGQGTPPAVTFIDWADLVERYDNLIVLRCSNPDQGTVWEIRAISDPLRSHPVLQTNDQFSLFAEWLLDLGRRAAGRQRKVIAAESFDIRLDREIEIIATVFPFGRPRVTHAVCQLSDAPVTN